jgi:hypothetical protein
MGSEWNWTENFSGSNYIGTVPGSLACEGDISLDPEALLEPAHFIQQFQPLSQHIVHSPVPKIYNIVR